MAQIDIFIVPRRRSVSWRTLPWASI